MAESANKRKSRGRALTAEEAKSERDLRQKLMEEFPPKKRVATPTARRIAQQVKAARTKLGLTFYAVAKQAGIPNPRTVQDIEEASDPQLSTLASIAEVLGLRIELVQHDGV
jgi:DNA-binding XRE family transcriptional regulator